MPTASSRHRAPTPRPAIRRPPTRALALGGWAALQPALEPLPCRLPTPDLVELLKGPLCVGEVRRVVLDQLANRYGRPFADHWEFVRFAEQQRLGLDFTTAPRRPTFAAPR
ncbi:MAG: hypothetical protein L0Z62_27815 [Gemmataceae bacterium]|nr:hypothetical protein [Gemmataceae bacterium]